MVMITSFGAFIIALLLAYLFFAAPTGTVRSLVMTLLNVVVFLLIVYIILYFFQVVTF